MKKAIFILISSIFLFSAQSAYSEKIKVVASIYPLGDLARQIGGERVDVSVLLPAGASPHTFEPTPSEMMQLNNADVFLKVGAGLEFWAEKMIKALRNKKLVTVDSSSGLTLIKEVHSHAEHYSDKRGKKHKEAADPHIWLDPVFAQKIIDKIEEAFSRIDPGGKNYYSVMAQRYRKELETLHNQISDKVGRFSVREYVTFHPAWNYFSQRYGLRVAGVIEESPGREPSPKHIAGIVKELKKIKARVVFAEPQFNTKIAEIIAKEAGAKVLLLDPIGGKGVKGRETYLDLMRYNLAVMEEAMK